MLKDTERPANVFACATVSLQQPSSQIVQPALNPVHYRRVIAFRYGTEVLTTCSVSMHVPVCLPGLTPLQMPPNNHVGLSQPCREEKQIHNYIWITQPRHLYPV
jgi:hypothetical protein